MLCTVSSTVASYRVHATEQILLTWQSSELYIIHAVALCRSVLQTASPTAANLYSVLQPELLFVLFYILLLRTYVIQIPHRIKFTYIAL